MNSVLNILDQFGLDLPKTITAFRGLPLFLRDLRALRRQVKPSAAEFAFGRYYPFLADRFSQSGTVRGHYFLQDLLVARRIYLNCPRSHVDVGSRIDGFVAHVATFREIEVFDVRPLDTRLPNITFRRANLMEPVGDHLVGYCDSLSCLHALEHFGLGRYGDPVEYNGHLLGLANLERILQRGGKLYLSVPIGPQRIEFNAHRVFAVAYLLEKLKDRFHLDRFSYINDHGNLFEDVAITGTAVERNFDCVYGCGIFEGTKL